jgi:hypothetical protein
MLTFQPILFFLVLETLIVNDPSASTNPVTNQGFIAQGLLNKGTEVELEYKRSCLSLALKFIIQISKTTLLYLG